MESTCGLVVSFIKFDLRPNQYNTPSKLVQMSIHLQYMKEDEMGRICTPALRLLHFPLQNRKIDVTTLVKLKFEICFSFYFCLNLIHLPDFEFKFQLFCRIEKI